MLILGLAGCKAILAPQTTSTTVPTEATASVITTADIPEPPPSSTPQAVPDHTPTPADIPMEWLYVGAPAYGFSWRIPRDWQKIEDQWLISPSSGTVLLDASASDREAASLLSSPGATFPDVLMVLTVYAVTAEAPPLNLQGARPVTVSQQPGWLSSDPTAGYVAVQRPGWVWETGGDEAAPYTWRATLFIQGLSSYSYTLSFGCALPSRMDAAGQADFEASCRRIWEQIVAGVEVVEKRACLPAPTPTPGPVTWRRVGDDGYKYSFEVPANWYEEPGVTPDRRVFFSDPALVEPTSYCPSSDGLMKLDFAADPPGKYQPHMQPDLTGMSSVTVAGRPAWIAMEEGGEAAPSALTIAFYISGPEYWYHLWMGCTPARAEVREQFIAECREVMEHILDSFRVLQ